MYYFARFASFEYIMLWVYGHYFFVNYFSAETVFRRQNLMSIDFQLILTSRWKG